MCQPRDKYSFWIGGLGEYSHQKSADQNPAFHFVSGAAWIGFDYSSSLQFWNNLAGFSGGYAYTHLVENGSAGHANINYYFANIYDTYYGQKGYLELAVWGVYHQIHNYRHIAFPVLTPRPARRLKAGSSALTWASDTTPDTSGDL